MRSLVDPFWHRVIGEKVLLGDLARKRSDLGLLPVPHDKKRDVSLGPWKLA